jgi:hypothetical protein
VDLKLEQHAAMLLYAINGAISVVSGETRMVFLKWLHNIKSTLSGVFLIRVLYGGFQM